MSKGFNNKLNIQVIKSSNTNLKMNPQTEITNLQASNINDENTRKKVTLGKGYSLMDWIKKTRDSVDLAGTNGIMKVVTHDELKKHNKIDDCWMVIYGSLSNFDFSHFSSIKRVFIFR